MEASKPFYIAGGNVKRSVTMENSLTAPQKVNTTLWPRSYNFGYIFKRTEEKCFLVLQSTHTYTHTHTHIYTLSTIAKTEKQSKFPSMYGWINKLLCIHVTEYYAVIKRNEVQRYTSTWKNSEILRPSEKSKTQNITYCVILFIGNIQNKCIHRSWT